MVSNFRSAARWTARCATPHDKSTAWYLRLRRHAVADQTGLAYRRASLAYPIFDDGAPLLRDHAHRRALRNKGGLRSALGKTYCEAVPQCLIATVRRFPIDLAKYSTGRRNRQCR